jgi:hypothetical protein
MKNGEHSTFNIQLPTSKGSGVGHFVFPWVLSVECWALNVFFNFPEAAFRAGCAGDSGRDERGEMKKGEHSTFNIQLPTSKGSGVGHAVFPWVFGVECSMLNVSPNSPEVLS